MTIDEIQKSTEFQVFDRKSARIDAKALAITIIAFANADGGKIALGVEDDGKLTGVDGKTDHINELLRASFDYCVPSITTVTEYIDVTDFEGNPNHIILMTIPQSMRVHANQADEVYYRVGDKSKKLNFEQRMQLVYAKGEHYYEDAPVNNATIEDIDMSVLEDYLKLIDYGKGTISYLRENGYVIKKEDYRGKEFETLSGAAVLLFGKNPQQFFQRAQVRVIRYDGTEAKVGTEMNVVKDVVFTGPILKMTNDVLAFVKTQIKEHTYLGQDGRFKTDPQYPEFCWTEICVNSICHRDYSILGTDIQIKIFDDHITVESPGILPGLVRPYNIREMHFSRNPKIAAYMHEYKLVKEFGEGVDRMFKEMAEAGQPEPEYRQQDFMVYATIRERVQASVEDQVGTKSGLSRDQVVTKLLPSSYQVVAKLSLSIPVIRELLQKMVNPMSAKEMREFCGQKGATYFKANVIDPLIAEGLVAMTHQDSPNSPNQKYYLTDLGKAVLDTGSLKQAAGVSEERVKRLIDEFAEALPQYLIGLPVMEEQYKKTLPVEDVRCFFVPYLMKKEMFKNDGAWIHNTPELYLTEIQANIWQHYNVQFLMHQADASYQIRFSEIKEAFKALGVDGRYAVITSFYLGTFDALNGGDILMKETEFGYLYGDMPIYRVPSHEARMIVMKKELLPRCKAKVYEGPDKAYKLINKEHLLYSNLFNMKEETNGLGLVMMRDLKFYMPDGKDFHYVKLMVDRMERVESELDKIKSL